MVINTEGANTTRDSQRDEPDLRMPIISPLSIGPRYVAVVSTLASAGSCHVPPFLAIASWWMVLTITSKESRRVALLLDSTLYRMTPTPISPSTVHAPIAQPR